MRLPGGGREQSEQPEKTQQIQIRRATPAEAEQLSALAMRSKAHWGYPAAFLEACRPALTLTSQYIAVHPVFVAVVAGAVGGFYGLAAERGEALLDYLFIEPEAISGGIGRLLWEHAIRTAEQMGYKSILIESDPNAEAFYLHMGAVRIGERLSGASPGRMLPWLRFSLKEEGRQYRSG